MNDEPIHNLTRRLDEVLARSRQLLDEEELSRQLEELRTQAEKLIRQHPVKSVAAGFLAGYIIAKIFNSEE